VASQQIPFLATKKNFMFLAFLKHSNFSASEKSPIDNHGQHGSKNWPHQENLSKNLLQKPQPTAKLLQITESLCSKNEKKA
jgi:hypothetical protein